MPEWFWLVKNVDFLTIYYATQLVRCAAWSVLLAAIVALLRKTVCRERTFLRGALWTAFALTPFLGRLRLYYEWEPMARLLAWPMMDADLYRWFCRIYMAGVVASAVCVFGKRRRLWRAVSEMETTSAGGVRVRVTDFKLTPFTVGLLRPAIVLPRLVLEQYDEEERALILEHERTHIRLGHLWAGFAWDVLRCLLWVNPLLALLRRQLCADMEDICDRVCIERSGRDARAYGLVLLKSIRLLRGGEDVPLAVTYAGEKAFPEMKRRMEKIVGFRPYGRKRAAGLAAGTLVAVLAALVLIRAHSYGHANENTDLMVCQYDGEGSIVSTETEVLRGMISYDDGFVYVEREPFEAFLEKRGAEGEISIIFGGFYKLPGMGGAANACFYERGAQEGVVRIPYENRMKRWDFVLYQLL